jgi:hypothetical protein
MVGTVKGGSADPHSMVGGLNNGILFGMETTAEFVPLPRRDAFLLTEASDIQTVLKPRRRPIVTGRQNLLVLDENGSHLSSQTGRPLGDQMGDIHEILFPGRPMRKNLFFLFLFQG